MKASFTIHINFTDEWIKANLSIEARKVARERLHELEFVDTVAISHHWCYVDFCVSSADFIVFHALVERFKREIQTVIAVLEHQKPSLDVTK